jgi:iron complex outermembrane recepter protein
MVRKLIPLALLSIYGSAMAEEAKINLNLSPVVVTGTRIEQNSFDLPMSINAITADTLHDATQQVQLSETAARIPGVVVNSRNHGAQELSISSRGFGPRSQFGIRGIRLYADGIPLTMPDGQGFSGLMNLDNASSIEFLRGPFSALYGNSSGGVVQLFTKNGSPGTEISAGAFYGSYGTHRETTTLSGEQGGVNYVLNASHYETRGYRDFSGYKKDFLNAKVSVDLSESTKLTLVAMDLSQPYVRDPGALTRDEFKTTPSAQAKNTNGTSYYSALNVHKEMQHTQSGVILDHKISENNSIKTTVYMGSRSNVQATAGNALSGYDRDFGGVDLRWIHQSSLLDKPWNFTAGINYDKMRDMRYRWTSTSKGEVVSGSVLGRNEINEAFNFDQYLQSGWNFAEKWSLQAGVRHTMVIFDNSDKTSKNNDSHRVFEKTTPVVGLVYNVTPTFNLYANAGKGFETPTFAETAYGDTNANTSNPNIKASSSKNYEVGAKAFLTDQVLMNLAFFKTFTENEIVMKEYGPDAAVYRNAGKTERKGVELSLDGDLGNNLRTYLAYSYLDAEYKDSFSSDYTNGDAKTINSGNKIPGAYKDRTYAEVSWRDPSTGFFTALEGIHSSKVYVNDTNTESANAYTIFNWRGGFKQQAGKWSFTEFARIDNITNRDFVSSIKVNDANGRYYEPGNPSNWTVGVNASYKF